MMTNVSDEVTLNIYGYYLFAIMFSDYNKIKRTTYIPFYMRRHNKRKMISLQKKCVEGFLKRCSI